MSDGPGISVAAIITRSDTVALSGSLCTGRTKNQVHLFLYSYELFKCEKTVYGHAGLLRVAGWISITAGASERYLAETTARHGRFPPRGSNQDGGRHAGTDRRPLGASTRSLLEMKLSSFSPQV